MRDFRNGRVNRLGLRFAEQFAEQTLAGAVAGRPDVLTQTTIAI
ncbi:hypothetical protein [Halomonas huangheensis]|nr:hypothetical protein [Halomonas huangheensis]